MLSALIARTEHHNPPPTVHRGSYTNWAESEPNNYNYDEEEPCTVSFGTSDGWYDVSCGCDYEV